MQTLASRDVATVRTMRAAGWIVRDLARMFGVSEREINRAITSEPIGDDGTGPSDRELDRIFGIHTRPPGVAPGERGDVGTSQKSNGTENA